VQTQTQPEAEFRTEQQQGNYEKNYAPLADKDLV
jgi:hypothetical protein